MTSSNNLKRLSLITGAALAMSVSANVSAAPDANPFGMTELSQGVKLAGEGKCGESKCGSNKSESKGAEAKCGESKAKSAEGKCGSNKKPKSSEGKCGESKCGGNK